MPSDRRDVLRVGESPTHGRGVFAQVAAPPGAVLETGPVLPYAIGDGHDSPVLSCYSYRFDDRTRCLALGLVTLCNHDPDANAAMEVDPEVCTYRLVARRPIAAGTEVCVDYAWDDGADRDPDPVLVVGSGRVAS